MLTREKLLTSARKLYLRIGYDGTSIEKMAEDGGFSRGAFYAHFSPSEAIFLELVRVDAGMLFPELLDAMNSAASRDERSTLFALGRTNDYFRGISVTGCLRCFSTPDATIT